MAQNILTETNPKAQPDDHFATTGINQPNPPKIHQEHLQPSKKWSATNQNDFPPASILMTGHRGRAPVTCVRPNVAALASGNGRAGASGRH